MQHKRTKRRKDVTAAVAAAAAAAAPSAKSQAQQAATAPPAARPRPRPRATKRTPLFTPFRALGYVTNHVPSHLQVRVGGKDAASADVNILTCLGDTWALWDLKQTTLLFVASPPLPVHIADLAIAENNKQFGVLAVAGNEIIAYHRSKAVKSFVALDETSCAHTLRSCIVYGDTLLALSSDGSRVFGWNLLQHQRISAAALEHLPSDFAASVILHPATYVDKILLGSASGDVALYNVRTGTLLHIFPSTALLHAVGGLGAQDAMPSAPAVVDLAQSPALDVVAVAWSNGLVLIHDIKHDESLMRLSVESTLSRGCLAFRSDGSQGGNTLAVGSAAGDVHLFDLAAAPSVNIEPLSNGDGEAANGQPTARPVPLIHTLRGAHASAISSIRFLPGNPLLITTGSDNAIRQWFFEPLTGPGVVKIPGQAVPTSPIPRLLKSREGHFKPPHLIKFYGEEGRDILSAAEDRSLRLVSVVRDSRSAELSQGPLLSRAAQLSVAPHTLKLSRTSSLAFSTTRARDWDNVLSVHAGSKTAHRWSTLNRRLNNRAFSSQSTTDTTCCAVSVCGNFGFVGDSNGFVRAFNMQSGVLRRSYEDASRARNHTRVRPTSNATERSPVTGIISDAVNSIVAVAKLNGTLSIYDFHTTERLSHLNLGSAIASMKMDRTTGLVATSHDDLSIRLLDLSTRKVVRHFTSFKGRILDMDISTDGRWLIVSSLDGLVRTFDIPSARLIDAFRPEKVVTSLSFSPTGEFLATSHVAQLGIYLWSNRTLFSNVPVRALDEEDVWKDFEDDAGQVDSVALPGMVGEEDTDAAHDSALDSSEDEDEVRRVYTSPAQIFGANEDKDMPLVTLTTMPRSRWMTLLNLDMIKARNKPIEPPKKPEKVPFFLPQVAGTEIAFDASATPSEAREVQSARRLPFADELASVGIDNDFVRRLKRARETSDFNALFLYLHTLSAPALDLELRSLGGPAQLTLFIEALTARLEQHLDYEAVQAMLAVFCRVHTEELMQHGVIVDEKLAERRPPSHSSDRRAAQATEYLSLDDSAEAALDEPATNVEQGKALTEAVRRLLATQHAANQRVVQLLDYCLGSLSFVRDVPLV
ncbi:WD40 repeat-like protein [Ceraceosorus guamensis]|uniref:WD40 repeat-like protein n=1 Tax=Ceraceosorus guamensis TaxID=1522189 RepID=A0A316VW03_9BASI|nr:WD40 repeat-like protein [Ceraceosorus guamensis]PWN40613.1 WD40 repeat-like protein [Ceraceosorus guamensis]